MNSIMDWFQNNLQKGIALPTLLSTFQFLSLLIQSASDGMIDEHELHRLLTAGSGINLIILLVVYIYLRLAKRNAKV